MLGLDECVRSALAPELGEKCMADPLCKAIVYKPAGLGNMSQPIGAFRQASGANESLMVRGGKAPLLLCSARLLAVSS